MLMKLFSESSYFGSVLILRVFRSNFVFSFTKQKSVMTVKVHYHSHQLSRCTDLPTNVTTILVFVVEFNVCINKDIASLA